MKDKIYKVVETKLHRTWFMNDLIHRDNGPAREWKDGTVEYFKEGKLHREDGPATIYPNGDYAYYINGKQHRVDGPSVQYNGWVMWYRNGERLKEVTSCGTTNYWRNEQRHCDNGPAIVYPDGECEWYINGEMVTEEEYEKNWTLVLSKEDVADRIGVRPEKLEIIL